MTENGKFLLLFKIRQVMGESPGLVVVGDDSCLRSRGFESRLDIFSHKFVVKIALLV